MPAITIQLIDCPPYHSKYNPVERGWGILEWAKSMTWKGIHPIVELSRKVYAKG
jgi:hypothetical protein